jgi:signal transduction histidine kinase
MMHDFLRNNREELIASCKEKVAQRPKRLATPGQLQYGIPLFLDQLTRTLRAEQTGNAQEGIRISGAPGGDSIALSEIGVSAAAHGKELLNLGFSVDQVVHDYGDLCQSITDLAFERDAPFAIDEFRTLNRCLDNAIADAVSEFSRQRDFTIADKQSADVNERLGILVHELRNSLGTANFAIRALETGNLPIAGATGSVLKRSLFALGKLVDRSLAEVRFEAGVACGHEVFSLASFIEDASLSGEFDSAAHGCSFSVPPVDPLLLIDGNRDLLQAALANLLGNAFKFTQHQTEVRLLAYAAGDRILIEVRDHCGGLPPGFTDDTFKPFSQHSTDRSGLGLGLSIAQRSIEADGGTLAVTDMPGTGCVFTMNLPLYKAV